MFYVYFLMYQGKVLIVTLTFNYIIIDWVSPCCVETYLGVIIKKKKVKKKAKNKNIYNIKYLYKIDF